MVGFIQNHRKYLLIIFCFLFSFPLISQASSQSNGNLKRCPKTYEQVISGEFNKDLTGCEVPKNDERLNLLTCSVDYDYLDSVTFESTIISPDIPWGTVFRRGTSFAPSFSTYKILGEHLPFQYGDNWAYCFGSGLKAPINYNGPMNLPLNKYFKKVVWAQSQPDVKSMGFYKDPYSKYSETYSINWSSKKKLSDTTSSLGTSIGSDCQDGICYRRNINLNFNQCGPDKMFKNNRCVECITDDDCSVSKEGKGVGKCLSNLFGSKKQSSCSFCENIGGVNATGTTKIIFVSNGLNINPSVFVDKIKDTEPFKYLSLKNEFSFMWAKGDVSKYIPKIDYSSNLWSSYRKVEPSIVSYAESVCGRREVGVDQKQWVIFIDTKFNNALITKLRFGGYAYSLLGFIVLGFDEVRPNFTKNAVVHELGHGLCNLGDEYYLKKREGELEINIDVPVYADPASDEKELICPSFDSLNLYGLVGGYKIKNCFPLLPLDLSSGALPLVTRDFQLGDYGVSTVGSLMGSATYDRFNAISCAQCLKKLDNIDISSGIKYCGGNQEKLLAPAVPNGDPKGYPIYDGVWSQY